MYGKTKNGQENESCFFFLIQIQQVIVFAVQFANAKALERKYKETIR